MSFWSTKNFDRSSHTLSQRVQVPNAGGFWLQKAIRGFWTQGPQIWGTWTFWACIRHETYRKELPQQHQSVYHTSGSPTGVGCWVHAVVHSRWSVPVQSAGVFILSSRSWFSLAREHRSFYQFLPGAMTKDLSQLFLVVYTQGSLPSIALSLRLILGEVGSEL